MEEAGTPSTRPQSTLVELLSAAVGVNSAREAIASAARALRLGDRELTRAEALAVMDEVCKRGGLVGITARLAKSRILLNWQ